MLLTVTAWIIVAKTTAEYLIIPVMVTYPSAVWGCVAHGGRMIVITAQEEEDTLLANAYAVYALLEIITRLCLT